MDEIILIVTFILLLIGSQFLLTLLKPSLAAIIRLVGAFGLLVLVWMFADDSPVGPRIILTALAFAAIWREFSKRRNQPS